MRVLLFIGIFFFCCFQINAQNSDETEGVTTYISSQNVYVKFKTTNGMHIGDTLFISQNNQLTPCLIIKNLSSTSVVCNSISVNQIQLNEKITSRKKTEIKMLSPQIINNTDTIKHQDSSVILEKDLKSSIKNKQVISGQFGISGYSYFSNTPAKNAAVVNYALALNITNISESKFSLESNVLFRQEKGKWSDIQNNVFNGLKIYSLSLKYQIDNFTKLSIGRSFNPNISSIGAIDGLQIESYVHSFCIGGFVGSRPNYLDYSFNLKLMQYGAFLSYISQKPKLNMQNTIGFVEQTNNLKTDRRFLYFQHNNNIIKDLSIFYTLEADFYDLHNNQKQNKLNITNTYLLLRYRPSKKLTLSGTYDSRKNIIYFESDKNFLSTYIDNETRQGVSFQVNYNIWHDIYAGARAGYRTTNYDNRPSKNIYFFISHANLFHTDISTLLSFTKLETNYLNGDIYNVSFSRSFFKGKMNAGFAYSFVNYNIVNAELPLKQHIANINLTTEIIKKLYFTFNAETNYEAENHYYRIFLQLRKRF
ncbi:MAG: hypothetical protein NTZ33_08770 [Bacteroidetes bacterium]|nr:hypothetical protein [Bacteroidota bacterium]